MDDRGLDWDDDYLKISYHPWGQGLGSALAGFPEAAMLCSTPEAKAELGEAARVVPVQEMDGVDGIPNGVYVFTPRGTSCPIAGIALTEGAPQAMATVKQKRAAEDDDPLHLALILHQKWSTLESAATSVPVPRFSVGDLVRVAGERVPAKVLDVVAAEDGSFQYELQSGVERFFAFEDELAELPRAEEGPREWLARPPASAADIEVLLTLAKLSVPLTDTVYSFQSSRTVFRPYQFRPVLRLINGSRQRLLIADEVGLGKTIEAGLIWNELEQRMHLRRSAAPGHRSPFRALVVCPSVLVHKWRKEMEERFDRRLEIVDGPALERFAETVRRGEEHDAFAGVISLERLRRAGQLDVLAQTAPRFDLVIVDEAHYVRNPSSRSHAAVSMLSDWADTLVLLSATPLNLGNDDLFTLVSLLDPSAFPSKAVFQQQLEPNRHLNVVSQTLAEGGAAEPGAARSMLGALDQVKRTLFGGFVAGRPEYEELRRILDVDRGLTAQEVSAARRCLTELNALAGVVTRTRKVDTPDRKALRVPEDVEVEWSEQERTFYRDLHQWCLDRARRSGTAAGFAAQMWLRQAASCIPAMQQRLEERFSGALGVTATASGGRSAPSTVSAGSAVLIEAEDQDSMDAVSVVDAEDTADGVDLDQVAAEAEAWAEDLSRLPGLLKHVGTDNKFERFVEMLRRVRGEALRQVMVFSYFTRTLEYLAKRLSPEFSVRVMHGKVPQDERTAIMADFRAGAFDLLLVSEVGSEGLDFEFCNVLVNYDLPWNPMRVEQRIGRLDRFGQTHEKIFIFNMQVPGTIETDIFQRLYDRINVFRDSIGPLEPILRGQLKALQKIVLNPLLTESERQRQVDQLEVAQVDHGKDIAALAESRELLVGLDDLLIQGFDDTSPGLGRYLGASEIKGMLERFFTLLGHGRLRTVGTAADGTADLVEIIGDKEVANTVNEAVNAGTLTVLRGSDLPARLRERTPVRACFTSQTATLTGAVLLSVRHPLVRTAEWYLRQQASTLPHFGHAVLPGLPPGSRYLVEVRLADSHGVVPRQELWSTAADLGTGVDAPAVGPALLTALAAGDLRAGERQVAERDQEALLRLWEGSVRTRSTTYDHERRNAYKSENERLREARRTTVDASFQVKIETARRFAATLQSENIRRLHASRADRLEAEREVALSDLTASAVFSFRTRPIALVLLDGPIAG